MPFLLIGVLTLLLCVYLLRELGRAPPAQVAANIRTGGGVLSALIALLVLIRGRLALALGFGGLSLFLFTGDKISKSKFSRQASERRKARHSSHVRTAFLEMVLDHATGEVDGRVAEGEFAGAMLSELSREQLERLRRECAVRDPDSLLLLDNYFDRRFAGWR